MKINQKSSFITNNKPFRKVYITSLNNIVHTGTKTIVLDLTKSIMVPKRTKAIVLHLTKKEK